MWFQLDSSCYFVPQLQQLWCALQVNGVNIPIFLCSRNTEGLGKWWFGLNSNWSPNLKNFSWRGEEKIFWCQYFNPLPSCDLTFSQRAMCRQSEPVKSQGETASGRNFREAGRPRDSGLAVLQKTAGCIFRFFWSPDCVLTGGPGSRGSGGGSGRVSRTHGERVVPLRVSAGRWSQQLPVHPRLFPRAAATPGLQRHPRLQLWVVDWGSPTQTPTDTNSSGP